MTEPAPMAESCRGMMKKPFSSVTLIIPGLVFILLGIVTVLEPRILVWLIVVAFVLLIAVAFVLFGLMLLVMASFVRKIGMRFQNMRE